MSIFRMFVDTSSEKFAESASSGGNILCTTYIEASNNAFPSDSWLDFPVIVLSWWLDGYLNMAEENTPVENDFMNGPYEFVCMPHGDEVSITFRRRMLNQVMPVGSPLSIPTI